jgi:hypothetical protein
MWRNRHNDGSSSRTARCGRRARALCSERRAHSPRPVQRRRSPVRIRRCPATAMPRSGTSQVDRSAPRRTSALGGRAVRAAPAAGPLLRRRGGFCERTNDRFETRALAASQRNRPAWRAATLIPPSCVNEIYEARMAKAFAAAPLSGVEAVAFGDCSSKMSVLTGRDVLPRPASAASSRSGGTTRPRSRVSSLPPASRRRSSAPTYAPSTPPSLGAGTASGCSPSSRPASTPAARTASSTPSSPRARSSPSRSPTSPARSSNATDSSSAT